AGASLRADVAATSVLRGSGGAWTVELATGEHVDADTVLLAVPAHAAARLARTVDEELARSLASLRSGSTAAVFLGYRRADVAHPLDGVGFVVPRALGRPILAGTWVSSKWRARAPQDDVLLRAFLGGQDGEALLGRSDDELAQVARDELRALMGLEGQPLLSRVFRFAGASAQMQVGHLAAMRALHERVRRVAPGLRVAGGGYEGIGIPDCVRQGTAAGRAMVED
ncbi:MAG: protoporphyrinogen oxidase, partial [Myxococcota bacterium]|nr:protoporphyrinogen oxidase [Myxococcota bacterium]